MASPSYLFIHASLPLVLEAFSLTPCLFSHGLSFSLSCFRYVFQNWSVLPLPALSGRLSGWWKLTSINSKTSIKKHTVNSGDYPAAFSFIQSSLHLHCRYLAVMHAKGSKCSQLLPQAAGYGLQGDFVSCMVLSKKQEWAEKPLDLAQWIFTSINHQCSMSKAQAMLMNAWS